ncbi:MAG: hypothetical protein HN838_16180, partial [Rhodospirillaceae bacterium]|nr:hypothetical protein [Rhodospirillaceae bacterium]
MNSLESHAERNRVLEQLNVEFREQWKFGSNALVGWRPVEGGIDYIVVPALAVFSSAQKHRRVVNGGRMMGRRTFAEVAELLET